MKIEHISISRKGTWEECDQKYKFRYHLKMASPEPTPIYFTFGKAVHKIIEEYTRSKGNRPIDEIKKDVISGVIPLEPGAEPPSFNYEQQVRLHKHVTNFMRLTDKIGLDGDVEQQFRIDLDPPNNRFVTGFIDRLIKKDGIVSIIDYKTTKAGIWRKTSATVTKDLQLQCYCWVLHREGIPAKNIRAALFYLDDAQMVPVTFSEETLRTVPQRLLEAYKDIENADPDRVRGHIGLWCKRCEYKTKCSFFQGSWANR